MRDEFALDEDELVKGAPLADLGDESEEEVDPDGLDSEDDEDDLGTDSFDDDEE